MNFSPLAIYCQPYGSNVFPSSESLTVTTLQSVPIFSKQGFGNAAQPKLQTAFDLTYSNVAAHLEKLNNQASQIIGYAS